MAFETPYQIEANATLTDYHQPAGQISLSWHGSAPFAPATGDKRFVVLLNIDVTPNDLLGIAIWKSLDAGATWTEADAANRPGGSTGKRAQMALGYDYNVAGDGIWISYIDDNDDLCLTEFSMTTETWGSTYTSSINLPTFAECFPVVRANGEVVVLYRVSPSDTSYFTVYDGSWLSPVTLNASVENNLFSGALHASSGDIWVIGGASDVRAFAIHSDNTASTPVAVPQNEYVQSGGKVTIAGDSIVFGQAHIESSPDKYKLITNVGAIAAGAITWSGTLSGYLTLPAAPTTPIGSSWAIDNIRRGAFAPLDATNAAGVHINLPEFYDSNTVYDGEPYFHSHLLRYDSSGGTVTEGSTDSLYDARMTIYEVSATRMLNGNVGVFWRTVDDLVDDDNSALYYMELEGSALLPLYANEYYATVD